MGTTIAVVLLGAEAGFAAPPAAPPLPDRLPVGEAPGATVAAHAEHDEGMPPDHDEMPSPSMSSPRTGSRHGEITPPESAATRVAQVQSLDQLFEPSPQPSEPAPADEPAQPPQPDQPEQPTQPESVDSLFDLKPAEQPAARPGPKITGFFQNELAYTYPSPDHWSKFKNTLELSVDGAFDNGIPWRIGGRLVYDPIYDLTSFYPSDVRDDQRLEAEIGETYVDLSLGDWELRLGRQHIIWGEVVGGFVADVVSAKDFRENIVQDFDLLRIPQWAARAEYFKGDFHGELIWIPYASVDDIGEPGADFYPFPPPPPPGFGAIFADDDEPGLGLSNFGYGARASYLVNGWDLSLLYYTSRDQRAAFQRRVRGGSEPAFLYQPIHERIHQIGATVTKDLGPAVFKLESVYTIDRLYSLEGTADPDGLTRQDVLEYIVGLEWVFPEDTRLNVQFAQSWFTDHVRGMVPDELETGFTVYLSTKALHPKLKPEILWISSLNRSDWLLEAKIGWDFATNWRAVVGADIFSGPPLGLFGQHDEQDRIYYELRYTF